QREPLHRQQRQRHRDRGGQGADAFRSLFWPHERRARLLPFRFARHAVDDGRQERPREHREQQHERRDDGVRLIL
ncbi:MAG: hypothetical protein BJ554DRAFT_3595, partial [Olpidium bornovanus]